VKRLLPHTDPIGHLLGNPKKHPSTIVGVARDSKYRGVDEEPRAMAYFPYTQGVGVPLTLQVELRTKGDPEAVLPSVERAMHEMDPTIPLEKPMSQAAVFEDFLRATAVVLAAGGVLWATSCAAGGHRSVRNTVVSH
jgi:hypothetical protein